MECRQEFARILASLAERKVIDGSATVQHIEQIYKTCTECSDQCETARVFLEKLDEETFKSLLLFLVHGRDGEIRLVKDSGKVDAHFLPVRTELKAAD